MRNSHPMSIVSIMALLCLSSCGKFRLIGPIAYNSLPDELQWKYEKESRLPRSNIEELVVRVAADHHTLTNGNKKIVYISDISGGQQLKTVVAVSEEISGNIKPDNAPFTLFGNTANNSTTDDPVLSPRKVERYLIQLGRILASMGPSIEPFPDEQLERAINAAAIKTVKQGGYEAMLVSGWSQSVILKGQGYGCGVELICYSAQAGGRGKELFRKMVNGCMHE